MGKARPLAKDEIERGFHRIEINSLVEPVSACSGVRPSSGAAVLHAEESFGVAMLLLPRTAALQGSINPLHNLLLHRAELTDLGTFGCCSDVITQVETANGRE